MTADRDTLMFRAIVRTASNNYYTVTLPKRQAEAVGIGRGTPVIVTVRRLDEDD